jgi:hypothetical protein
MCARVAFKAQGDPASPMGPDSECQAEVSERRAGYAFQPGRDYTRLYVLAGR